MSKIEKERRINEYNIQSINTHLVNILEENYYIELGNVDIKVLDKLFSGHPVALSEIYYFDITTNGIGRISGEVDDDVNYQLNYLYSLHQKSSSSKFILTCGTAKYLDNTGVEKFAPIVLIPLSIDYVRHELVIVGNACFNTMLLRICKSEKLLNDKQIDELTNLANNKIENVYELDNVCVKLRDITGFEIETSNYLSLMEVEYSDYVEQENFFNVQRSIFEINDIELIKKYFKNVHAIKPSNIEQKYVILKAHNGENIVIDGKLGAGKSSTALNIIADKIYDGKKVLYVNQDLDNISDFRRYIKYLGFEQYAYDLTKNVWNLDDLKPLDVVSHDKFDESVIDEIAAYRDTYHRKFHGYPYSYILEKLATRKSMGLEDKIYLETNLDREEVEYIYKTLKEVEVCLSNVDPLPNNVWARLQSGQNSLTPTDIKNHTKTFYEENKKLMKYLDKIAAKHHLNKIDGITAFYRIIEEINSFKLYKPLPIWGSDEFVEKNIDALHKIAHYVDYYDNCVTYYNTHCTKKYVTGSIADDFKSIINKRYQIANHNSSDVKYVDELLNNFDLVENLHTKAVRWVKASIGIYDKIKDYFDFESPSSEQFVLLNKLLNLLETTDVDDAWFEEFILNPKLLRDKAQKLNKINTQIIEQYQLLEPFLNMNEMTYELMDELVHSKRYVKIVKGLLNKDDLKRHKSNASIVATNLKLYFEKVTELKAELPKETKLNILDENTWGNYLSFLNFIDLLTPWETIVLNLFIKKTQSIKNFKRSDLIKDLVILRENQRELEVIESGLATFNLRITGSNFIESVKSIKSYIPYLAQVLVAIENIKSYFKNSANITTYDILYLIEIDKQFTESKKHFEENDEYYKTLYGNGYLGKDTDVITLGQTVEHFRNFINKLKIYDGITKENIYVALLNDKVYSEFMESCAHFDELYESWYNALRGFSICFYQGKLDLQNETFAEINKVLSEYVNKLDQLEPIYRVEHILDSYYYYGLRDFAEKLQNGYFNNDISIISELYLYSTMNKYYNDMLKEGHHEFSISNLVRTVNMFAQEEEDYCENNIFELRKRISGYSNKKRKTFKITPFVDPFNSIVENTPHYKKIFIADIDVFNRMNDFSFFDIVIIDDAHLSTSNKYSNLYKASQVVILGDASFQSSATNSLMQRNKNFTCIPLHKRYIEMKSEFGNIWQTDNQYIYTPSMVIEKNKVNSLSEMADMIIEKFKEHYEKTDKKTINVLVTKSTTRREIYSLLVNRLKTAFSTEDVIKILNLSIKIISTNYESNRLSDYTYMWYEDLEDLNNIALELVKRNYITAKHEVHLCYLNLRKSKKNEILMEKIDDFIGEPLTLDFRIDGITKIIYNRLIKKGIEVEIGPGYIDLVIKKNNKNLGFIIYGQRTDMCYSMVDDYIYYVNEYKKRGWDIHIYCMEELNKNLDDVIERIYKLVKEGNK